MRLGPGSPWAAVLVIGAVALAQFHSALAFPFVQDDWSWLWGTLHSPARSWFLHLSGADEYRPVSQQVWFWLGYRLWGPTPALYHATLLLCLALASVALVSIVARLTGSDWAGLLAGVLYAANPAHLQGVGWVSGASETFLDLFALLAVLAYLWDAPPVLRAIAVAVTSLLAMCSKETAVVLPAALGVCALLVQQRRVRDLLRDPAIVACLATAVSYMAWHVALGPLSGGTYTTSFTPSAAANLGDYSTWAFGITSAHVWKWFRFPAYGATEVVGFGLLMAGVAVAIVARSRTALFGVAWIVLFSLPVLPFPSHLGSFYATLPAAGAAMAISGLVTRMPHARIACVVVGAGLLVAYHGMLAEQWPATTQVAEARMVDAATASLASVPGMASARAVYVVGAPSLDQWAYGFEWMFRDLYPNVRQVEFVAKSPGPQPSGITFQAEADGSLRPIR